MIMSLTGHPVHPGCCFLLMLQQRYRLRQTDNQSQIHQESCCRKLKDNFVHHWGLNSMGLTTSRRCLHISKSDEVEGDREEHNGKQSSSAAHGDCDSTCSFVSWKALRRNTAWPDSALQSQASGQNPAHKPPNSRPNIPSAGPLDKSVRKWKISEMLRVWDKQAPHNWTSRVN